MYEEAPGFRSWPYGTLEGPAWRRGYTRWDTTAAPLISCGSIPPVMGAAALTPAGFPTRTGLNTTTPWHSAAC